MATQPRERDAARSRASILDAAERLFARDGFDRVRLSDIGQAAGLSRGTPAYFFGGKQALHEAVMARGMDRMREALRPVEPGAAIPPDSPAQRLGAAVGAYFDFLHGNPDLLRLIERDAMNAEAAAGELPPHLATLHATLAGIATSLQLPAEQERQAAHLLLSILAFCSISITHAGTLVRGLGFDPTAGAFVVERRHHVVGLALRGMAAVLRTHEPRVAPP
jgi:AcrR family transcriptional regulator